LASGSGTNLQALIDRPGLRSHIALVISDKPAAPALDRAKAVGVETAVLQWGDFESREKFSDAVIDRVEAAGADLIVLAGFMRILSSGAVDRYRGRIVNVHPSLLPAFPGVNAVEQALEHGVKITGVTVHFVDEGVDTGPIIAQRAVPVEAGDDVASLHARIQVEEHDLLPAVITEIISGVLAVGAR
jgi:phosphoribosylglycinamide formyltransferase-1